MRIYKLLARLGYLKKRLYPWFDAPVADAPKEYLGWVWDKQLSEYVETKIEPITVDIDVPRYPEPTQEPRPEQPLYVPGWYWYGRAGVWSEIPMTFQELADGLERGPMPEFPPGSGIPSEVEGWSWSETTDQWVATILVGEPMEFVPPPTLPPEAEKLALAEITPTDVEMIAFFRQLMRDGSSWDTANMIVQFVKDGWLSLSAAKAEHAALLMWRKELVWLQTQVGKTPGPLAPVAFYAAILVGIGLLIATIISRLFRTDREYLRLLDGVETYLLGPENWTYSRDIGRSLKGHRYFSGCDDIGTDDVRHKRGFGVGQFDYLDFPGGFVESGYKFPYFVKYTWERWELKYVGFLERRGSNWYVLKVDGSFAEESYTFAYIFPTEDWCPDFHWYL